MDKQDLLVGGRLGHNEVLFSCAQKEEPFVESPVFLDGKDVPADIEHPVIVAVNKGDGKPPSLQDFQDAHHAENGVYIRYRINTIFSLEISPEWNMIEALSRHPMISLKESHS
jgi:hypothetical protein